MTNPESADGREAYKACEAVGILDDAAALDAAVDELERSGFDCAAISVLASDSIVHERLSKLDSSVQEIEDNPEAAQSRFKSKDDLTEGKTAAIGIPLYIGGIAGGLAVVASSGAVVLAITAAIAAGVVGAGIGGLLARLIAHRHIAQVAKQLAQGGLVLWVSVLDDTSSARALDILIRAGARDVHEHEIARQWTLKDRPFAQGQPDPLL